MTISQDTRERFMAAYFEHKREVLMRSLLTEYPLRIFLMASTNLTPPAAFGGAHG